MSRSIWKTGFVSPELKQAIEEQSVAGGTVVSTGEIKTKSRSSMITPEFVGKTILVHVGNDYKSVTILPNLVGHKLGEFGRTKEPAVFKRNKKKIGKL